MNRETELPEPWPRVIGIVGGLGPHAHIHFEQQLLRAAEARVRGGKIRDQDYPPYLVASLPGTPDRTEHLVGRGPSPLPWLERSLRTLRGGRGANDAACADFAVIACHTAHAFVPALEALRILPILDIVKEAVAEVGRRRGIGKIGLLATTGTIGAGIFQRACDFHGLTAISPLDLADGERLQQSLVMEAIYGGGGKDGVEAGIKAGIKGGAHRDSARRARLHAQLERAAGLLVEAGVDALLAACTEIPLVLPPGNVCGVELLDPLEIAAQAALEVAAGARELPSFT